MSCKSRSGTCSTVAQVPDLRFVHLPGRVEPETSMVTVDVDVPPSREIAVRVYVVVWVGRTRIWPDAPRIVPGTGEIIAVWAFVRFQRSVDAPPSWIDVGVASKTMPGRTRSGVGGVCSRKTGWPGLGLSAGT